MILLEKIVQNFCVGKSIMHTVPVVFTFCLHQFGIIDIVRRGDAMSWKSHGLPGVGHSQRLVCQWLAGRFAFRFSEH